MDLVLLDTAELDFAFAVQLMRAVLFLMLINLSLICTTFIHYARTTIDYQISFMVIQHVGNRADRGCDS